jgi:curli biogenesis system outer membrane secretion channel CsgG
MHSPSRLIAAAPLAALFALAACGNETVDGNVDPQAEALKNAPVVAPPPMIQASRTYRCKDNSLLYAEFYTDNSVKVRTEKDGAPTALTAEGGNPPYKAEGYSLSANAPEITYSAPGKGSQSCRS